MKFTEEQYQEIITRWDSRISYASAFEEISDINLPINNSFGEALALANHASRKWAHDNFVEKEKKYVWSSKNSLNGYRTRLFIGENGIVTSYAYFDTSAATFNEQLTESEIKAWGYNPEMFDREEVQ